MSCRVIKLSVLSGLILGASSVMAAESVKLNAASGSFFKNHFSMSSGVNASKNKHTLKVLSNKADKKGVYHQRLEQRYDGIKVVGGYAIIHSSNTNGFMGSKARMNGTVFNHLEADLGSKPSDRSKAALSHLMKQYKQANLSEAQSELIIYIDNKDKAHWAYHVSFLAEDGKSIPKRPNVFLKASSFESLQSWNDIKTLTHQAYGVGAGGNEKVGEYAFSENEGDFPRLEITRDDATKKCYMETPSVKVIDMDSDYYSNNRAMNFDCLQETSENTYKTGYEADGYDRINGAYSPSNDAMFIGYVIQHMYKEWYNVDALTKRDGSFMQVVMRVHYGDAYENAFWDGKQMTYGDGDTMMHPLVSMGVGAHEISHGFTQQHSDLSYYSQSGGMNESFSDMAAMAAVFYAYDEQKTPNFMIGDMIMKKDSGYEALRFMDRPSRDGRSIDSADDYYEGLDVHYSSGVFNRLFYLMASTKGWNTRKAFDVMVKANSDYWTPYEKYQSGACGVLSATEDYQYERADVENALRKVGLDPEMCNG